MITIFHAALININRSFVCLYQEFRRRAGENLAVYDVNSLSLAEIKQLSAASSLVVIDNSIYACSVYTPDELMTWVVPHWRGSQFYQDAMETLLEAPAPRLYIACGWDLHWPGPQLESILPRTTALAWAFEKKPLQLQEVPERYRDPWMSQHTDPIDNWNEARQLVQIRIEFVHSLAMSEFARYRRPKWWDVCIAGMSYATRNIAREQIGKEPWSIAPYAKTDYYATRIARRLQRIASAKTASRLWIRGRQVNQELLLRHSRTNFVCGSGLSYPVRKYFEVSAARSSLVAYPCVGFEDYGFKDGENTLVTVPEDVNRAIHKLLDDDNLRERLSAKAYDAVYRLHSVRSRVSDLLECMVRLEKGSLKGAQFVRGHFEIY